MKNTEKNRRTLKFIFQEKVQVALIKNIIHFQKQKDKTLWKKI